MADLENNTTSSWNQKIYTVDWHSLSFDKFPEWELEEQDHPAFVKLQHTRTEGPVESSKIASAWDDLAEVKFYQRDWTEDGLPSVNEGDTYWSGWWFQTIAERDRFLDWHAKGSQSVSDQLKSALASILVLEDEAVELKKALAAVTKHRAEVVKQLEDIWQSPIGVKLASARLAILKLKGALSKALL